jgi:hypothetical protein
VPSAHHELTRLLSERRDVHHVLSGVRHICGRALLSYLNHPHRTCIRYAVWPSIFRLMLEHSVQSLFLGTFAMGFATIVNMISTLSPKTLMLAWGLWWFDVAVSILIAVGVPFLM